MEMYFLNQLAKSLKRLYTGVPSTLLKLLEVTWGTFSLSFILGKELYKCVLLIIAIVRAILHLVAYFLHLDPLTFDAVREMVRIYLDPEAAGDQKERPVLEHTIARLQADNMILLRKNQEVSARLCSLEAEARDLKVSLSKQEDTTRQLLLSILTCRQTARSRDPRRVSTKLQLSLSPTLLSPDQRIKDGTDDPQTRDNDMPQLLVQLLMFRRSSRCTASALNIMISANGRMKDAARRCDNISQSLLIELLTFRKHTLALHAQNRMKSRLATILVRTQQRKMQTIEAEHETTIKHMLIQMLTLRRRLSHLLLSRKSSSADPMSPSLPIMLMPSSVSYQSLTNQLESLRLSEAQARAEKESLVTSLSEVLASLPLTDLSLTVTEKEQPIKELVLALAFFWKMSRRQPPSMAKFKEMQKAKLDKETNLHLREEQLKVLRPDIPSDSVRARAFKLGPPTNKSAIPIQETSKQRVINDAIHSAYTSITFDSQQDCVLTHASDSHPLFPPGIPLPSHLARSTVLPSHHQHISSLLMARLFPAPIHPPQSTFMTRGGHREVSNDVQCPLLPNCESRLQLTNGSWVLRDGQEHPPGN